MISYIQRETELTRKTIVEILKQSDRLKDFIVNPQKYMDAVKDVIKNQLNKVIIEGIEYHKIEGQMWSMRLFQDESILSYLHNRLDVSKSVYDAVVYDSEVERRFAESLDKREDIELFVKLPSWFKVDTPVGFYNPDWAIVKKDDEKIYLIAETKGSTDVNQLRKIENDRIKCGKAHFDSLELPFKTVTSSSEV